MFSEGSCETQQLSVPLGSLNTYQWLLDGASISGATSNIYEVTASGAYSCEISNESCSYTTSTVSIETTAMPVGESVQSFCDATIMISDIEVTGENVQWYDAATGGALLSSTTTLTDGQTVYASQTINGCEGPLLAITISANDTVVAVLDSATLSAVTGQCEVTSLTAPTATDACAGVVNGVHNVSLPITNQGTTVVTWTYDDGNGNTSTQTQDVVIDDTTPPNTIAQDITIDLAGETTISIVSSQIDDGSSDNCEIATFTLDVDTFTETGDYTVSLTVEDVNGNYSSATSIVTVVDSTVSIENQVFSNSVLFFPNPTANILNIELENEIVKSVTVYSLLGKKLIESSETMIHMSTFPVGMYVISLITESGKIAIRRIIKK